ncbi:hypothetical protein OUZ56_031392 [Daphnia magna]|uniref:Uncharacterized protein n=1 Tax=Daphnia magna TaxID=35525 RepID=A0ABQ9ZU43_9CRUS|nr:hypothetical protein OUZ56_031392 [Daphnia magna]
MMAGASSQRHESASCSQSSKTAVATTKLIFDETILRKTGGTAFPNLIPLYIVMTNRNVSAHDKRLSSRTPLE